jgi:DNA-binding transcriptional MocR family regulator
VAEDYVLTCTRVKAMIVTVTIWTPDLRQRPGPRYRAIADALADDAAAGRLPSGVQLPTHRELAERLGVTVGTITRAYSEAARRGLVSGEVGRGTFVRATAAPSWLPPVGRSSETVLDLSANLPPLAPGERLDASLGRALATLARRKDLQRLLDYPPEGGALAHRQAGAAWVRRCGLIADPERVLVSSGSQHGMTAVFAALLSPGDLVLTEALTYPGMKALAGLLSLRLQGVAMDQHGLIPEALADACRTGAPRALYCMPSLQNPTTAVMPESRRREVAAIARAHGLVIVEDDVHGHLPAKPLRPLSALAPETSIYLNGTSKSLAPGLRVGFIVAPDALVGRLAAAIRGTTWMAAPLMAELASRWIQDGTAQAIVEKKRREAAARQALAARVLAGAQVEAQPGAYHLWLGLPGAWSAEAFADAARGRGVVVTPAAAFAVPSARSHRSALPAAVRVCLGAAPARASLERGLNVLAGLLESPREPVPLPTGP